MAFIQSKSWSKRFKVKSLPKNEVFDSQDTKSYVAV